MSGAIKDSLKDRLENTAYVWNQLDYAHDAIIEASAGTGKTYALESIVLKLICDRKYAARNILLVTFTEKAAGELKNRVRETLDKAGELPPDFDEMTICTIHSFCRQLLSEYAFENGVPMQCEIGNDGVLAHQAVLGALKESAFADQYRPDGLFPVMEIAKVKSIGDLVSEVEKQVQKESFGELLKTLDASLDLARKNVAVALDSLDGLNHGNIGEHVISSSGKTKSPPPFYDWLKRVCERFRQHDDNQLELLLKQFNPRQTTNPVIETWNGVSVKKQDGRKANLFDYATDCEEPIGNLVVALKRLDKAQKERSQKPETIEAKLHERATRRFEELKKSAALLTFDDMVARAAAVVTKEPETDVERDAQRRFFDSVRERYRVALVDEFQDTDDKQWGIFHTLFSAEKNQVEGGKPGFLLVVGDPKQSIYSFRGADVGVYCKARDEIKAAGGDDSQKSLDVTYRATRPLVDAFNVFFLDGADGKPGSGWFQDGAAGQGISYARDVEYPKNGNGKFDGLPDDGIPVRLLESVPARVDLGQKGGFGNKKLCLPFFMENAAKEMKRLAGDGDAERGTSFKFGDMCVLVDTRNDAAVVRQILARHGIPYGQYKQQGLYDSAEAEGVLALLDYLDNPNGSGNRAALLLSPLFGKHPSEVPAFDKFPAFDDFIETLQALAAKRRWSALFEKVMSDPCTALVSPRGDVCAFHRTRAAVRQIFDKLLSERGRLAPTVADFAAALRAWRKDDQSAGEDGALYRKESDADRVQIMTMHASKGLEFPVVFLAYGFSPLVNKKLTPEEKRAAAHEERRRLVYVALTRAERLLYLPWSGREEAETSGIGSNGSALCLASPECAFLGKAIKTYFTTEGRSLANAFPSQGESRGTSAGSQPGDDVSTGGTGDGATGGEGNGDVPDVDVPEGLQWFTSLRFQWDSFSSLPHSAAERTTPPPEPVKSTADEKTGGGNDEANGEPVEPVPEPGKKKSLLPSGNISGSAFHEIMEELCKNDPDAGDVVDFRNACAEAMAKDDSPLMDLIRRKMRKFSIRNRTEGGEDGADSTEKVLLRMVRHALETDIDVDGHPFQLREIPHGDRLAEVEFAGSEQTLLPGIPDNREGALNGAIDLLVRKEGRVYIIDWKTNTLQDYGAASVEAAMDKAGYRLQYRLYALAADAWLKGHGCTLSGAAYLFVRGGENGMQSAVYKEHFGADGVERFRAQISTMGYFGANAGNSNQGNQ